jgi:mannose-1-phosphate guanylyltransferase / mannose-6-phosphate isomerase
MSKFKNFIINNTYSIKEALLKIEINNKGFLLVLDENDKVVGTVTDGDIRRLFLSGMGVHDVIKIRKDFVTLKEHDNFQTVCSLFKSKKIAFLPIVDKSNKLVNIVTKKQFHVFLLHDREWNSSYDFNGIDDNEIDYEIYNRPWGFYKTTLLSDFSQLKTVTIFSNEQLSLQEHNRREEHWVVVKGHGKAVVGEEVFDIFPGKYIYIPKFCKHQIINDSDNNIIFSEVQLGDYFGEDDIIRHTDKYGRKLKGEN